MVLSKDMKIAICFGLIMGALISICNMCFADDFSISIINDLAFDFDNEVFVTFSGRQVGYFLIEPGYKYTITNTANANIRRLAVSSQIPSNGVSGSYLTSLSYNESYTFTGSQFPQYVYFDMYSYSSSLNVIREPLEGMTGFIDNLAYDLSYSNLSGVLFFVVPLMAISILFGLGFVLLLRIIKKMRNAKGGM